MEGSAMKRLFAFIGALMALAACNNGFIDGPAAPVSDGQVKVNLTINRSDVFGASPDTKASVKNDWADGDVVFVFFNGIAAPKYLEMKYNGGTWTSTFKNGLSASDLGASGTMTAVYFPYGNDAVVAADGNDFIFNDMVYAGVFLQTEQVGYTYENDELGGVLNMAAPALEDSAEKYIHFDVSGYADGHTYALYQKNVKPVAFNGVLSSGKVSFTEGKAGMAVTGYIDAANGIVSFSGILDASVVGKAVDYQFSVNDETASVLYTRDAGKKTLNSSKYIGLGDLTGEKWIATEYVYMGFDTASGEKLYWATKNLGATSPTDFGDFFAWMKTDGHSMVMRLIVEGDFYFQDYDLDYRFNEENYDSNDNYGDPASAALKGLWRMPTEKEFSALINSTSQAYSEDSNRVGMMTFTSNVSGYEDRSLCFPAGLFSRYYPTTSFNYGFYWSSFSLSDTDGVILYFDPENVALASRTKYYGMLVRPVFTIGLAGDDYTDVPDFEEIVIVDWTL